MMRGRADYVTSRPVPMFVCGVMSSTNIVTSLLLPWAPCVPLPGPQRMAVGRQMGGSAAVESYCYETSPTLFKRQAPLWVALPHPLHLLRKAKLSRGRPRQATPPPGPKAMLETSTGRRLVGDRAAVAAVRPRPSKTESVRQSLTVEEQRRKWSRTCRRTSTR